MLVRHAPLPAIQAAAAAAGFQLVALRPGPAFAPDGHRFRLLSGSGDYCTHCGRISAVERDARVVYARFGSGPRHCGRCLQVDGFELFFERLFEESPNAYVKTARATYDGAEHYRRASSPAGGTEP